MNKLERLVEESKYWKRDPEYCAKRIGISIEEFIKIRKNVKSKRKAQRKSNANISVNIEKGEARFEGKSTKEPKDANEIINLLKIDTTKWKLSQYWNKQMSDHWRISALVTKIKESDIVISFINYEWKSEWMMEELGIAFWLDKKVMILMNTKYESEYYLSYWLSDNTVLFSDFTEIKDILLHNLPSWQK